MTLVHEQKDELGVARTCVAIGLPRSTYYRRRPGQRQEASRSPRRAPARKLPAAERQQVLDVLHEPRFADWAPAEVWSQLLGEGTYLCSRRTMYRILAENVEVRERRDQLRRPQYEAPQLMATRPNELWSWDITKLLGPRKWNYYYLYVVLDVFSRYAVGWLVAERESGELAKILVSQTCERQGIEQGQLTIHSDRGSPMKSKVLAQLYADFGITKTHSRPHVSNDNPFSESQFKTIKYRPEFPKRFGCLEDARSCSHDLINWYNEEHHHSSLAYLTPYEVHHGLAEQRLAQRAAVLDEAYRAHPERFVHGPPEVPELARAVWINPPKDTSSALPEEIKNEAGPEGPASSGLPPARRSGCSSAEPYPPSRCHEPTHPDCPQGVKPRGLGQSPKLEECAPLAALH